MALTSYDLSRVRPVVDESSLERTPGAQIDWADITAGSDGMKRVIQGTVMSRKASGKLTPRSTSITLTSVVVASNVATATKTNHGYSVGDQVYIAGSNLSYANGLKTVASVPDANTFTYAASGANATATGTITSNYSATHILETNATDSNNAEALTGYSALLGGVLYENLLPDATGSPKTLPPQYKTELTAAGCTFKFHQYADSRAS